MLRNAKIENIRGCADMTPNKIKELRIIRYLIVYEEMEHQLQCGLHERARLEHELRKYTTPRKGYHELKMYQDRKSVV